MNNERKPVNIGHGHVHPRPDGVKARCGGPAMCPVCATDVVEAYAPLVRWRARSDGNSEWADYEEREWSVHVMDQDGDASVWSVSYQGKEVITSSGIYDTGIFYHYDIAKVAAIAAMRLAQREMREHLDALPCRNCDQHKELCDGWRNAPRINRPCCTKCDHTPDNGSSPHSENL